MASLSCKVGLKRVSVPPPLLSFPEGAYTIASSASWSSRLSRDLPNTSTIPDLERDTHSLFCAFQDDALELVSFTPQLGCATSVWVFGQMLFGVILGRLLVWLAFERNYHLNP